MTDAQPVTEDLLAHAAFVRKLARSLLLDAHSAEDLEQDTWRRSLERPPSRRGDLRPWLATVARNLARRRRHVDARRSERERDAARQEALPAADSNLVREEMLQRVVDGLRALDEPYRSTILARYYEDLPPRAIAARQQVPLETVHTRLRRGLAQLRAWLERGPKDWRGALGLLAGESPCLPTPVGTLEVMSMFTTMKPIAAAVAVLLASLAAWKFIGEPADRPEPERAIAAAPGNLAAAPLASTPAAEDRQSIAAAPARATELSGRVVDQSGAPVPEARVHVLAPTDPFGEASTAPKISWDPYRGRTFDCDAEGRWRAVLPEPKRVVVTLEVNMVLGVTGDRSFERWVEAPAEGVDFVVKRIPSAVVEVRVVEGASRRPVEVFSVVLRGEAIAEPGGGVRYEGGYYSEGSRDGVLRKVVPILEAGGQRIHVVLTAPVVGGEFAARPEQDLLLTAGETRQVEFVIQEREVVRGRVVDEGGAPIEGAVVFFGEETGARGDEPFRPLRFDRILDGAKTATDGWFELRGDGPRITAIHAEYSSSTVGVDGAGRIALAPRSSIRGRALDLEGRPVAGATLQLDRRKLGPTTTTDPEGAFSFERVEAGAHALWSEAGKLLLGVRVASGKPSEVELRLGDAPSLELEFPALAQEEAAALKGLLVGFDERFSLCAIEHGRVEGSVLPGRYWLATQQGIAAPFHLAEGDRRARVELGSAILVVRSTQGVNLQAVPADADPFLRLAAARAYVKVRKEAEARFRLHPGRYLLVGEAGVIVREVDVPAEGLELDLD